LIVWSTSTFVVVSAPSLAPAALIGPVALAIDAKRPFLLWCCLLSELFILLGSVGEVSYIGTLSISQATVASALTFANVLALGVYLGNRSPDSRPVTARWSESDNFKLVVGACLLLGLRFLAEGVPILHPEARLSSAAAGNHYLGLFSGVLPVVAAFLPGTATRRVRIAQLCMLFLVVGIGSRLLLGAVALGVVGSLYEEAGRTSRGRFYLISCGILGLFVLARLYLLRTSGSLVTAYSVRASGLHGLVGGFNDVFGESFYYASRNGLSVFQILQRLNLHPPHGFFVGGLANATMTGPDPERWLTTTLGFRTSEVGASATPVWAGLISDYGSRLADLAALALGTCLGFWTRRFPQITLWAGFSLVLSFYGSYLVSPQFLTVSILLTFLIWWNSRREKINPKGS
jgi:hypothetical protein